MADLYRKALQSERKSLWAACRLKGLAKDTPERQRIAWWGSECDAADCAAQELLVELGPRHAWHRDIEDQASDPDELGRIAAQRHRWLTGSG